MRDADPNQEDQGQARRAAADECSLRLQVGRRLRGRWLAAAVLLRGAPAALLFQSGVAADKLAPSWVIVEERTTGRILGRVAAGRDAGAGEHLLTCMQADSETMTMPEFRTSWDLRPAPVHRA